MLPGSHRADGATGKPEAILEAIEDSSSVVPVDVDPGSVTIYSSRLWHRGGANAGECDRLFCFLTMMEAGSPAPPGLIHTLARDEVGEWLVGPDGLRRCEFE